MENPFENLGRIGCEFQQDFLSGFINKLANKMEKKMLGQCDQVCAPFYPKDLEERWKRNVWEDLIFAIQLLKKFEEEIGKLHPDVRSRIRQLMN